MSVQVTVTLPDEAYQQAERLATVSQRTVADVLVEMIVQALPNQRASAMSPYQVEGLSDNDILALCDLALELADDRRLSVLLDRQQAGLLTDDERAALDALLHGYQVGLLRKAQALQEAVRRGLRPPLNP